jgi:hypothetical protein
MPSSSNPVNELSESGNDNPAQSGENRLDCKLTREVQSWNDGSWDLGPMRFISQEESMWPSSGSIQDIALEPNSLGALAEMTKRMPLPSHPDVGAPSNSLQRPSAPQNGLNEFIHVTIKEKKIRVPLRQNLSVAEVTEDACKRIASILGTPVDRGVSFMLRLDDHTYLAPEDPILEYVGCGGSVIAEERPRSN